jgi:hypothetical protein
MNEVVVPHEEEEEEEEEEDDDEEEEELQLLRRKMYEALHYVIFSLIDQNNLYSILLSKVPICIPSLQAQVPYLYKTAITSQLYAAVICVQ